MYFTLHGEGNNDGLGLFVFHLLSVCFVNVYVAAAYGVVTAQFFVNEECAHFAGGDATGFVFANEYFAIGVRRSVVDCFVFEELSLLKMYLTHIDAFAFAVNYHTEWFCTKVSVRC